MERSSGSKTFWFAFGGTLAALGVGFAGFKIAFPEELPADRIKPSNVQPINQNIQVPSMNERRSLKSNTVHSGVKEAREVNARPGDQRQSEPKPDPNIVGVIRYSRSYTASELKRLAASNAYEYVEPQAPFIQTRVSDPGVELQSEVYNSRGRKRTYGYNPNRKRTETRRAYCRCNESDVETWWDSKQQIYWARAIVHIEPHDVPPGGNTSKWDRTVDMYQAIDNGEFRWYLWIPKKTSSGQVNRLQ